MEGRKDCDCAMYSGEGIDGWKDEALSARYIEAWALVTSDMAGSVVEETDGRNSGASTLNFAESLDSLPRTGRNSGAFLSKLARFSIATDELGTKEGVPVK